MADIRYTVTIDAATGAAEIKKLEGEFNKLSQTTKGTGDAAKELESRSSGLWKQFALGQIVVSAGTKLLHLFWGELKSIIGASMESEKAEKGLESALFSTGRTASYLPEYFKKAAFELEHLTKYSHEETLRAQALMLQLSNLDKEGIQKATKGAMGLATVFNMDLASAAQLVAKWMQGNTDRLSRYGIHVNDTMTAEQKRNSVINQLLGYYPRVQAETDTYAGKLGILKNAYDRVKDAAGEYITKNEGVLRGLNWLSDALFDLAASESAVRDAKKSHAEIDKAWSANFYTAANAVKMNKEEIVKLIAKFTEMGPVVKGDISYTAALTGHLTEQEKVITTNWQALAAYIIHGNAGPAMLAAFRTAVIATIKPLKDLKAETGKGTLIDPEAEKKALEAAKKIAEEAKRIKSAAYDWLMADAKKYYEKLKAAEEKNAEDIKKTKAAAREWLEANQKKYFENLKTEVDKTREQTLKIINDIAAGFSNLFGGLAALSRANTDKRIDDLDKYYEAQKQQVADSLMTEQQKADQLKVLDEKHEIARKNLARSAAKDEKSYSVFQAIISTAAAVINAMTAKPFGPWNFIQAALVAALGAVQIATIKAQPIPLATGFEGMVRQPTTFVAGEAGPEYLSVHPVGQGEGGQAIQISLAVPIYLAGHKFDEKFIEIAGRTSNDGRLKIYSKAIVH
jgi:hypothetical protein